jgi:MFS family permease
VVQTLTPPPSFAQDRRDQHLLLIIVMLAVTAFGSLMTLITVALDDIGADLGASRVTMTWAITGLVLTMAVATPMAGTLGDVHGHPKVVLIGLISVSFSARMVAPSAMYADAANRAGGRTASISRRASSSLAVPTMAIPLNPTGAVAGPPVTANLRSVRRCLRASRRRCSLGKDLVLSYRTTSTGQGAWSIT